MVKTSPCNRGCGALIYFDNEQRSQSGKMIPMEVNTSQPHQCPKSTWGKGQGGQQTTVTAQQPVTIGQANQTANTNSMLMDLMKEIRDMLSVSPRTADNIESKAHADHVNIASASADIVKFNGKLDAIFDKISDTHELVQALLKQQGLFQSASEIEEEVKEGGDTF